MDKGQIATEEKGGADAAAARCGCGEWRPSAAQQAKMHMGEMAEVMHAAAPDTAAVKHHSTPRTG